MDRALGILLLLAVLYLFYRVGRLEQQLHNGSRNRSRATDSAAPGKVIPILKRDIEPGPYRSRGQRDAQRPENRPES